MIGSISLPGPSGIRGAMGTVSSFPYFDVRKADGKTQVSDITVRNEGEYGIAAKLRFRDEAQGKRDLFERHLDSLQRGLERQIADER